MLASVRFVMFRGLLTFVVVLAAGGRAVAGPVLAVANSAVPFAVGGVEARPEGGAVPLADGDQISAAASAPVLLRLDGGNRIVLAADSSARLKGLAQKGSYFYLAKGSLRYEARQHPVAICAGGKLYIPSAPGSGEIVVADGRARVNLTSGRMLRGGVDACGPSAVPVLLAGGVAAVAGTAAAGTAAGVSVAGVATAAAAAAGAGIAIPAVTGVSGTSAAAAAGSSSAVSISSTGPPSVSPISTSTP